MHCAPWLLGALSVATSTAAGSAPPPPPCAGDSNGAVTSSATFQVSHYNTTIYSVNLDSNGAVTSSATFQAFPEPKLVPWPQSVSIWPREDGYFYPNSSTVIGVNGNATEQACLQAAAQLLASEIALVTGGALHPKVVSETKYLAGPHIHLFIVDDGSIGNSADASEIRVETHGAVLTAASAAGMMSATNTFVQLIEHAADNDGRKSPVCSAEDPAWRLPDIDVVDSPAFGIRGVMVDAARAYLPLTLLKEIVVMCRLYKMNHLHLHLSDDGSFTFPSTKYPELAAKAKFSYKLSELQELQAFALARGITIIGEMDVPGHSSGLTGPLPHIFGFPSKPSLDVVNFADPAVLSAIQTIYDEIEAVFPSGYVMMGGDEVNLNAIAKLPEIKAAAKKLGPDATGYDLYRQFIVNMRAFANSTGRELVVWEGFAPAAGQTGRSAHPASKIEIPTDVIVTPFDCFYYPPPQLAADGYRIINAAWTPLYIAGGSGQSPELIYKWNPWLLGEFPGHVSWWSVPRELRKQVIGVKMAVWSTKADDTLCSLSGRLPAMSDRSWNPSSGRSYADYQSRVIKTSGILAALLGRAPPGPPSPPAPPPLLPKPPLSGFVGHAGECRDKDGSYGTRIEHNGAIHLDDCEAMCVKQGDKCDAYDWGNGAWCGIWGRTFTPADNTTINGTSWTWATGPSATKSLPVCQADASTSNTCYHRASLDCTPVASAAPSVGCLSGCTIKQCFSGGI